MDDLMKEITLKDQNCYDIDEKKIEYINARQLLVSNRIDLVAKYKFVEAYDKGLQIPFIHKLYYAHLEAFTNGTFVEPGKEDSKNSYENFVLIFQELIENIKQNGLKKEISVIPVGKNNTILNGSHRVAVAIYYDLTVPIVRYDNIAVNYNYEYFKANLLQQQYLDYMATEYIRLKENVFFACIWPRVNQSNMASIDKMVKECCDVVYTSKVMLKYQGLRNLMIQIYGHQEWCGNIWNGYKGISGKVDECYQDNSETVIYVLDNTHLDCMVDLKCRIREVCQIQNSSIHISDNSLESLGMAHLLLNRNSVDLLNYGSICKNKEYIAQIQQLGKELDAFHIDKENILIESSGVLGVYGIRNPSDIDILTSESMDKYCFSMNLDIHGERGQYDYKTKEDRIYDPNNYLFAYGIKFNSLQVLYEMKTKRNEKKDVEDCSLMRPYLEKQITYKTKMNQYKIIFRRHYRNKKVRIRLRIIDCLKQIHLYDISKKYYHMFKDIKNGR